MKFILFLCLTFEIVIVSNGQIVNPDVIQKCKKSIVNIEAFDSLGTIGIGTGFYISPQLIVTNYHVIKGAKKIRFQLDSDNSYYSIKDSILIDTINNDIAILKTTKKGIPLKFATTSIRQGEYVFTIGNPGGTNPFSVSSAEPIAALSRSIFIEGQTGSIRCIQINNNSNHGNSGGPLLNVEGEIVGICEAGSDELQNVNFAIPKENFYLNKSYTKTLFSKLPKYNRFIELNTLEGTVGGDFNILFYKIKNNEKSQYCSMYSNERTDTNKNCFLKETDTLYLYITLHNVGTAPIVNAILNLGLIIDSTHHGLTAFLKIKADNLKEKFLNMPIYLEDYKKWKNISIHKFETRYFIDHDEQPVEPDLDKIFGNGFKKNFIFPERRSDGSFWDSYQYHYEEQYIFKYVFH